MKRYSRSACAYLCALAITAALPTIAWACSFDTDCGAGGQCKKPPGGIYGICVGGLTPGNSGDRQPVHDPLDPSGTVGNTCNFDTDCGPAHQ